MTAVQEFFIQILSDHLAGRATQPRDGADWPALAALARAQQLDSVVFAQCRTQIPAAEQSAFKEAYAAALYQYANRTAVLGRLQAALAERKIPSCSVKGLAVAKYYPVPGLRTMGDCDLVVRPEDCDAAIAAVEALGPAVELTFEHEFSFEFRGLHFELHDQLVKDGEFTQPAQENFFNDYEPYMDGTSLDWSFHFLFLLMHLRKHFLNSGVGVRQFYDLAVLFARGPALRWDWIEQRLNDLSLRRFTCVCCGLIERWFGVSAPLDLGPADPSTLDELSERILGNGVFGRMDRRNRKNRALNRFVTDRKPWFRKRVTLLLHSLFPSYSYLRTYPGLEYVNGKPLLLPIAWVHRYGIILKQRRSSSAMRTVKRSFVPREELEQRQVFLDKMGL